MLVIKAVVVNIEKEIIIANKELIKAINSMDSDDKMEILIGILKKLEDNPELINAVYYLLNKVDKDKTTILQKGLLKKATKYHLE
jgi:hypothetical protein